jgi:hypothetical protein
MRFSESSSGDLVFHRVKFRNKLTYYGALYDKDKKGASTTARGIRTVPRGISLYQIPLLRGV